MKTLIVGAGVIGVIYGWALDDAGFDVSHLVRKGKLEQFKEGVKLDLLDERKGHPRYNQTTYALKCVDAISPSDGYDLIIVPTNMDQTAEALTELAPLSGKAIFLIFSGNWEGLDDIECILPRERYLLGYADAGGTIRDGVYWTNLGAEVHIGEADGRDSKKLEQVKALFLQADMKPDVQENMIHWLWQHEASVIGYAAGYAKHASMADFLADKELMRLCALSTKELYHLCELRGVDLKKYPEASFVKFPIWLVTILVRWNMGHNESAQRYTAHVNSKGSRREMQAYFNGVMKTAQTLSFPMPNTEKLGAYLFSRN